MTTITLPANVPFIEIARFAQSIGCDLITHGAKNFEMRPNPKAEALSRALQRADRSPC